MIFRYHLFRLFFWGVSSIIGTGRTVLFPLIIALFSGTATFVIATTGATSRVVFGRFSQFLGNRDFIDIPTQEIFNSFELGLLFLTDKSNGATIMVGTSCTARPVYFLDHRKPGHRSGAFLCTFVCRLHDVLHYRTDFPNRQPGCGVHNPRCHVVHRS